MNTTASIRKIWKVLGTQVYTFKELVVNVMVVAFFTNNRGRLLLTFFLFNFYSYDDLF